jgi:hypothetical protein
MTLENSVGKQHWKQHWKTALVTVFENGVRKQCWKTALENDLEVRKQHRKTVPGQKTVLENLVRKQFW